LNCEIAEGLHDLREQTHEANWLIVSGGDQNELRDVFENRNISSLFNGGIYGSPDTKDEILEREIANGNIISPALFLGDSEYDHVASSRADLDFVFLSYWTEFKGWERFCTESDITVFSSLGSLQKSSIQP